MKLKSAIFRINNEADFHSRAIKGDFSFLHNWFTLVQYKEDIYQIIHCWVRDWLESEYDCVPYDPDDEAACYQAKQTCNSKKDDDKNILITQPAAVPKAMASKHEQVVAFAKETYDRALLITDDHKTACKMMADVFITLLPHRH
jgi:hypothetical protein